jgi:hypothetical protein
MKKWYLNESVQNGDGDERRSKTQKPTTIHVLLKLAW